MWEVMVFVPPKKRTGEMLVGVAQQDFLGGKKGIFFFFFPFLLALEVVFACRNNRLRGTLGFPLEIGTLKTHLERKRDIHVFSS